MNDWVKTNWKENGRVGTEWARSFGFVVLSVSCPQGGPWLWSTDGSAYHDLCDSGVPLEVVLEMAEGELRKKLHEALGELGDPYRVEVEGEFVGEKLPEPPAKDRRSEDLLRIEAAQQACSLAADVSPKMRDVAYRVAVMDLLEVVGRLLK